MRKIALASAFMALAVGAVAQPSHVQTDHLVPEPSGLASIIGRGFTFDYPKVFNNGFPPNSRIYAVAQMGWFPPFAIALVPSSDGYDVVGSEVISSGSWNHVDPKEPLSGCKRHVSKTTAEAIIAVWDKMVLQTHDDGGEWPIGPDGYTAHYASQIGRRIISGWSGENEGKPRHLFNILFLDFTKYVWQDRE